jgi:16S rRNA (cytidine1402-2'-O)-methyltransferase
MEYFGDERIVSVSREISKMFEETKRGSMKYVKEYFEEKKPKGEFVIIVDGK